ncbi:MAG: PDZ domain-containing protein, partial [Planctomycetota bacterium]|nr:PDZ domain-containing protein [Planctomycetota bacterium]
MNNNIRFLIIGLLFLLTSCTTTPKDVKIQPEIRTLFSAEPRMLSGSGGQGSPWLGITCLDSPEGVEVSDVYINSPAQNAGIKKGDVIIEFGNEKVSNTDSLLLRVSEKKIGDKVTVKVRRIEEKIELTTPPPGIIAKDELSKKFGEFISKGRVSDKFAFKAERKQEIKEIKLELAEIPKVFHNLSPVRPDTGGKITGSLGSLQAGKKAGFLGITMDPFNEHEKFGLDKNIKGVKILTVSPASAAQKGGLKGNDIVISYDGNLFSGDDKTYRGKFADYIKEKGSGEVVVLKVIRLINNALLTRPPETGQMPIEADKIMDIVKDLKIDESVSVSATREIKELELKITLGTRSMSPEKEEIEPEPNDKIYPELVDYTTPIETLARKIMDEVNIRDKYDDLIKRFTDDEKKDDGFRLRSLRYMHRDPFKIQKVCDDFITNLYVGEIPQYYNMSLFGQTLNTIISKLDENIESSVSPAVLKTGVSLEEHCKQIEDLLQLADRYRKSAFAGLTEDDFTFLQENLIAFTDRWVRDFHFSDPDEIKTRNEIDKRVLQLCSYINYEKLFSSARILVSILSPDYLAGLKNDIETQAKDKEGIILTKDTPFGKVIISGKGNSIYRDKSAVVIDLEGDDVYANELGGSLLPDRFATLTTSQPFSIIIDFAGNDRYSSYADGSQGCGIMGVGILCDVAGDDIYIAQKWAQGSGLLGTGILVDAEGKDSYKGQEFV